MPATSALLPSIAAPSAGRTRAAAGGTATTAPPESLTLGGFELSLSTAPLDALERLARALDRPWLERAFAGQVETEEATLLASCSRRELVVLTRSATELDRWAEALPETLGTWVRRTGPAEVRHLYRVAAGLESMVVGEREIRDQVRSAARCTQTRHRHRLLRDLLGEAAREADRIHPVVPPSRSIAAVAATRVLELTGRPFPRVVVVGAGAVGQAVAAHLAAAARVTIVYRHRPPEEGFLRATGARAVRAADLAAEIALSDAVVTAAKSGDRSLGPADVSSGRSILLVDLGMPRNIDPSVRGRPGVRLVDLAALRDSLLPAVEPPTADAVDRAAERAAERIGRAALEPWVSAFRREVESVRADELQVAHRFLGSLTAEQEAAVDRLTRRLVERLVQRPTAVLRDAPAGAEGERLRRLAVELWRPKPREP